MRELILLSLAALVLTGCDEEKRQQSFVGGLKERKAKAEEVIQAGVYSTDKLLLAQEYFFDFAEKVHSMKDDQDLAESVKTLIKKVGAKDFCANFLMRKSTWKKLNDYCSSGSVYMCSFEIKEFEGIGEKFKELMGDELARTIANEGSCQ